MIKTKYYVALLEYDGTLTYITAVSNSSRYSEWKAGAPALALSKAAAHDVMVGLNYNGYKAVTIEAPDFCELKNKEENHG